VLGPCTLVRHSLLRTHCLSRAVAREFRNILSARTAPCCGQIDRHAGQSRNYYVVLTFCYLKGKPEIARFARRTFR
ncbi:MAG TPA: hypothetical protein PKC35_19320, partial [Leptospiraceae bacterium]|nr:hypothetical protein [Leptospiraceae bacterium]